MYPNYYNPYNPYLNNQNMYQSPQYYNNQRMNRPINPPKSKTPFKTPARVGIPKFTFSKFLTGTQEVISTISTAIPLYTQVKPLLSGARGLTKGLANKFFHSQKNSSKEVISNPEIITPKEEKKNHTTHTYSYDFQEENKPNKPFF